MVDTARSSSGVLARKEEVGGGGGRGEVHGQLGMVIGGQGVRACDACGVERARWYCAADDACLCERCDGSVHAANAVARRHERVRLGPGGAPARPRGVSAASGKENSQGDVQATVPPPSDQLHKRVSSSMGTWASRKRPRTRRHNPHRPASMPPQLLSPSSDLCVKPEPLSPHSPARDHDLYVPDHSHLLDCLFDLHDDTLLLHEVPIYTPLHFYQAPPCPPLHCAAAVNCDGDDQKPQLSPPLLRYEGDDEPADNLVDPGLDHFFIPGNSIDIEHFLDSADTSTHDPDLPAPNLDDPDDDRQFYRRSPLTLFAVRSPKSSSSPDETYSTSDPYCSIADGHSPDDVPPACAFYGDDVDVCLHGESPRSWLCKVKVESPPSLSDHDEVVLCHKLNCDFQADQKPKLGLKLDIEGVLDAWSDQGALWMDGQRPDESCLDAVAGGWVVPDLSYNYMHPRDQLGLVPSMNDSNIAAKTGAAREARVLRYKEKRRNRLFSKKIRYEVRKLNAEKRPRMKGRFVKRSAPAMD